MVFLWELPGVQLGIHQLSVELELKGAAAGGNQRQAGNLLLVCFQELGRQTDGLRLVISHRAVA